MIYQTASERECHGGFTVLEVVIALFIFGLISTALFRLIGQTERIRGRALYVENATLLAADEAERLRNTAAQLAQFEDSSYTAERDGRTFYVNRKIIEDDEDRFTINKRLEPVHVMLEISAGADSREKPLTFSLLIGSDEP